ncbi:XRE family transcriptional regulator [Acanthopleuribacter pedis]|uniref:ImmA/IrrE family metallo-endopeptidase n=1 Tax=Acanthopleuribacter pedis TaxID=442870 RepID=A0A8J7Q2J8_9BACT|nr:XRE family transcriptional regulator [Acanthopleuribacter pedis]MBO1317067.1 ImmA/IrrE family metallo-endopeptidase [Acanthopleuribacter pedis]
MGAKITAVNGQVLEWARKRSNLSLDQVAEKLSKDSQVILSWEEERDHPTYAQLEKIAYSIYKVPLAVFFFPDPPKDKDPKVDFRLIPESEVESFEPDTLFSIRAMQARQESLRELTEGKNPSENLLSRKVKLSKNSNIIKVCKMVRQHLGITLETQSSWPNVTTALKNWRLAIESSGIFVFKRSLKQKSINGFCLTDHNFPIICINNSTSKSRQIFTLFHELGHILSSFNGYTKDDLKYMDHLQQDDYDTELVCNRFAAEFLVPSHEFKFCMKVYDGSEESVKSIANTFNVSREVIFRKLLDHNQIDKNQYQEKREKWNSEWHNRTKGKGGGDYYRTQATYLGDAFLSLCFKKYYSGQINKSTLADHFGIKARNLSKLENIFLGV